MATTVNHPQSVAILCSRLVIQPGPSTVQACISILIGHSNFAILPAAVRVGWRIGGRRSAADWTAAFWMGNVPNTVKHCLSYEQLLQDYPWLRRWQLEEKVGVVFLDSNLQHMLCHMTLSWQRGCTAASHCWQLGLHAAYIMGHFEWNPALLSHNIVFLGVIYKKLFSVGTGYAALFQ